MRALTYFDTFSHNIYNLLQFAAPGGFKVRGYPKPLCYVNPMEIRGNTLALREYARLRRQVDIILSREYVWR